MMRILLAAALFLTCLLAVPNIVRANATTLDIDYSGTWTVRNGDGEKVGTIVIDDKKNTWTVPGSGAKGEFDSGLGLISFSYKGELIALGESSGFGTWDVIFTNGSLPPGWSNDYTIENFDVDYGSLQSAKSAARERGTCSTPGSNPFKAAIVHSGLAVTR